MPGIHRRDGRLAQAALAAMLLSGAASFALASDAPSNQPAEQSAGNRNTIDDLSTLRSELSALRSEVARLRDLVAARPLRHLSRQAAIQSGTELQLGTHPNPIAAYARSRLVARTYAVADLVVAVPAQAAVHAEPSGDEQAAEGATTDFASVEELITSTIEPQTWKQSGGEGTIERFPRNLSLVITQTPEIHEQIADLLEQLRRAAQLQVSLRCHIVTLPAKARLKIALSPAGAKRVTADEARAILDQAQTDKQTSLVSLPTLTIWPAQVANFKWTAAESREAEALIHTAIAADRRSARLSVAVNASDAMDALRSNTSLDVPDGDTLIIDITERLRPPARGDRLSLAARLRAAGSRAADLSDENAVRTLLLVTPQIIAPEEEEALLGAAFD